MCFNSELRMLYDACAARDIPWLHDAGAYARDRRARPAFGVLSMQLWQLVHDAGLLSVDFTLRQVAAAIAAACRAPPCVATRRRRVLATREAPGVWTFELPELSPFQACSIFAPPVAHGAAGPGLAGGVVRSISSHRPR